MIITFEIVVKFNNENHQDFGSKTRSGYTEVVIGGMIFND